jgi:DNA polymerase-4
MVSMSSRKILHLDLDAFFCAVEEQRDPSLRGKTFAVGGRPDERGVVASCSYAARRFGVHSAMAMGQALKICPSLIIVGGHYQAYSEASRKVMDRLRTLTPLVEQISIDEAFLDVSELPGPVEGLARGLQASIRDELGLPCSLGIASNKLVAKIATEVGKASGRGNGPPNALTIVPPGTEAEFLAPLQVNLLWGVGPKTAARLSELGIQTIGDLARTPEADLIQRFGKHGLEMALHARGIDPSPIVTIRDVKSISQETTFSRDVRVESELRHTLLEQAGEVARLLQKKQLCGSTVKIKLRWPDFTTLTRQMTLNRSTDQAETIFRTAEQLFDKVWKPGKAVRLLGVGVSGLVERGDCSHSSGQLELWRADGQDNQITEKERRLQTTISELQERFGTDALSKGLPKKGYKES